MVAVTSSGLAVKSTSVPSWPGPEVVGRDELDRCLLVVQHRDALLGAALAAERLVDRRAAVATVAPEAVHEEHEPADHEKEEAAADPRRRRE